jgi:hypothetical protein
MNDMDARARHIPTFISSSFLRRGSVILVGCAFAVAGASGCGSDSSGDDDGGAGASFGGAPAGGAPAAGASGSGNSSQKLGGFTIELKPNSSGSGTTTIGGNVYEGAKPENVTWQSRTKSGDCELLIPSVPFCSTACGSSEVCVATDRCAPYPASVGVGAVTLQGVGSADITMNPEGDTKYYAPPKGTVIPFPPAADGSEIRVQAAGGSLGPFTIVSEAIAPLAITSDNPAAITTGAPLQIRWTPGVSELARIHLELDLSHHGGTKGKIACDLADDGSVEIPSALLTELIGLGLAGFPTVEIARRAIGTANVTGGKVTLDVVSQARLDVTVPGLVSCSEDSDCPSGQTCQDDLQCK